MKNLLEFTKECEGKIRDYLPDEYKTAEIIVNDVVKMNDIHMTGLTVRLKDALIGPTLYLDDFFARYQDGEDIDILYREIAVCILDAYKIDTETTKAKINELSDYQKMKKHLRMVVCDPELNNELLNGLVTKGFGDYVVLYKLVIGHENNIGTINVGQNMLDVWGVTPEQLHADAEEAMKMNVPCLYSLQDMVSELMKDMLPFEMVVPPVNLFEQSLGNQQCEPCFVLTAKDDKMYSAALMFIPELLKKAADVLGESYYVLPSSIHEVLLLRKSVAELNESSVADLVQMVRDINHTEVSPIEILSDKVLYYDKEQGTLVTAMTA